MSKLRKENILIELVEKFPWLNDQKHRVEDTMEHYFELRAMHRKNGMDMQRYHCYTKFTDRVLERLQDSFLDIRFRYTPQGHTILTACFQPNNENFIFATLLPDQDTKETCVFLEPHFCSLKAYTEFLLSLEDCVFGEKVQSVGFLS